MNVFLPEVRITPLTLSSSVRIAVASSISAIKASDTMFMDSSALSRIRVAKPLSAFSILRRSEEHTSELQSLMRISYAVFCLKKKSKKTPDHSTTRPQYEHHIY